VGCGVCVWWVGNVKLLTQPDSIEHLS